MKYPINVETYIRAMRIEFGEDERAEEAHRVIIPLINGCYEDGLRGKSWYPMSLESDKSNPLILPVIAWCSDAYKTGREEVKRHG